MEKMKKPVISKLTLAEHFLCARLCIECCTDIMTHSLPRGKWESLKDVKEKGKVFHTPCIEEEGTICANPGQLRKLLLDSLVNIPVE